MPKLTILRGLPSSGKSTYALEQIRKSKGRVKRVNKDLIREMMDAGEWSKSNEKIVTEWHDCMVMGLLNEGYDVIVDNTHLHPKYQDYYAKLCSKYPFAEVLAGITIEEKFFEATPEECIRRDLMRGDKSVGRKIIMEMYNRYLLVRPKPVEYNHELPDCVVCDLDGTIAMHEGRNPYDTARCYEDSVNWNVRNNLLVLADDNEQTEIIFVSGREEKFREITAHWIVEKAKIFKFQLYMRKTGDLRKDSVVKNEIYEANIKDKYNVRAVIDDRLRVCRMWYALGLPLYRVGDPDADF